MANSDKNIVITPNTGQAAVPTISFTGFDAVPTSLKVNSDGSVYFEGTNGELLEVSNTKTGNVLEYGDSSGAPLFQVSDVGSLNATNFDVAGKNKIIGGSMEVWQRGTTGLTVWTADRFQVNTGNWQRDTDAPPGFPYSLATTTSPLSSWLIQHAQELPRTGFAGDLTGYWTLSFWAKYELGKEFYYASWFADVVGGGNQVVVSNYLGVSSPGRFVGTGQWQRYVYTFNIKTSPAGTNTCLRHTWLNLVGAGATTNLLKISGVQFEKGTIATPFSRAGGSYGGELTLCHRYLKALPDRVALRGTTITGDFLLCFTADQSSWGRGVFYPPTTMRVAPSLTVVGNAANDFRILGRAGAGPETITSVTLDTNNYGEDFVLINVNKSMSTNQTFFLRYNGNTSTYLVLSAEIA
jgi:hypothetical protein